MVLFLNLIKIPNSRHLALKPRDEFDIGVAAASLGLGLFEGGCAEPVEDEGLSGVLSSLLLPAGGMVSRTVILFTLPIVGVKL